MSMCLDMGRRHGEGQRLDLDSTIAMRVGGVNDTVGSHFTGKRLNGSAGVERSVEDERVDIAACPGCFRRAIEDCVQTRRLDGTIADEIENSIQRDGFEDSS